MQHRYDWRYLVGVVHPASGRTVLHLAQLPTTVSIPLFEVELAAFARQVGASPTKQIILVETEQTEELCGAWVVCAEVWPAVDVAAASARSP